MGFFPFRTAGPGPKIAGHVHAGATTTMLTDRPSNDSATRKESYLAEAFDDVIAATHLPKNVLGHSTAQTLAGIAKTVPLFMRGPVGLVGSAALHALDEAKHGSALQAQVADAAIGAIKGAAIQTIGNKIFAGPGGPAFQGVTFGVTSRALDVGLSRQTYLGKNGNFSLGDGLGKLGQTTFSKQALVSDVVIFGVGGKLFNSTDAVLNGALRRSPLLTTVSTGGVYGITSGALAEISREKDKGQVLNPLAIATEALFQGGVGAISAAPGGLQAAHAYRSGALSPHEQARYNSWDQLKRFNTSAEKLPVSESDFIDENVGARDFRRLVGAAKSPERVAEWKAEINRVGVDPHSAIVDAMKSNRVVGLGETHFPGNPWRSYGKDLIPDLKQAGATHLAVEIPESWQPQIDNYLRTGRLPLTVIPLLGHEHFGIMSAARESGMDIIAVDGRHSDNRNLKMAEKIHDILQESPDNKVVYWVGSNHLQTGGKEKATFDYLSPVYPVVSFHSPHPLIPEGLSGLSSHIRKPVAIPMDSAPISGTTPEFPGLGSQTSYQRYDYSVILPRPRFEAARALASGAFQFINPFMPITMAKSLRNL